MGESERQTAKENVAYIKEYSLTRTLCRSFTTFADDFKCSALYAKWNKSQGRLKISLIDIQRLKSRLVLKVQTTDRVSKCRVSGLSYPAVAVSEGALQQPMAL